MNRDFKGVWIPKEIWLNKELTALDKIIFAEIDSLDNEQHCSAGNEYFAEFCQCSESKVSKTIKKLIDMRLIEQISFDGRHRKLSVVKNTKQSSKKCYAESEKMTAINTSNNSNKLFTSKDVNKKDKVDYVQWFFDTYNEYCDKLPKARILTDKRKKAIIKILKKYSIDNIWTVFENANNSDFLIGKNDRGWRADIDFILREDKFVAILEGKYGKSKTTSKFSEFNDMRDDTYSDRELAEIDKLNAERRADGKCTKF